MEIFNYLLRFAMSQAGGITMMLVLVLMLFIEFLRLRLYSITPQYNNKQLDEFYQLPQTQLYLSRKRKFTIAWIVIETAVLIGIGITWFYPS